MRRLTSILMLALWGGFYAIPLLHATLSDSESDLPMCCRRNGKHHCAMMDEYLRRQFSEGPAFSAPPAHCPFYPQQRGQFWSPLPGVVLSSSASYFAELRNHPACHAQTEARLRISFDRARLKRGPPSSLLA